MKSASSGSTTCKASRRVSAYFGEQLGTPSVMNIWIPDGMKDITVDRFARASACWRAG
jgi:L-rhamnose isomerase